MAVIQIVISTDGIITFCAYNIRGVLGDCGPLTRFCLTPCVIRIWQNLSLGSFVKDVKEPKQKQSTDKKEVQLIGRRKQMVEPRRNFTIRLSELEEKQMKLDAEANGLNPSEYVRELILHGGSIDTSFTLDRRNLINQISSVGNNINQLTRLANTNKLVSDSILKQVVDLLKEIQKLMMEVIKKWR